MAALDMQRAVLDLFQHVDEPLKFRPLSRSSLLSDPVINNRDAIEEIEERLKGQMSGIEILPRGQMFSVFRRDHVNEAMRVVELLIGLEIRDLNSAMKYLRDRVNEELWVYATSVVISHRQDLKGLRLPPIEEVLPGKFFPTSTISNARTMERRNTNPESPVVIGLDFTGNDLDPEHRVAYWREDINLNAHHWHWHTVYPYNWEPNKDEMKIKDRKGELFYYMHQQMLARFDTERLSNNLSRVTPLERWHEPMLEGYAPHLTQDISGQVYPSRPANMVMQDVPAVSVNRLRTWYERIMDTIHRGLILQLDGTRERIDEFTGIDKLGDIVEASTLSANPDYYGSLHNSGHDVISQVHDPDGRFKEGPGVMGDVATAMRDPIFYRWHKLIDTIFQEHKKTLSPYTTQLTWSDVEVEDVRVQGGISPQPNDLQTFWEDSEIRLDRGLNFDRPTPVTVQYRHLQHEPFQYILNIANRSSSPVTGTVRIYLAPRLNELQEALRLNDQKHLFMEMDKFETILNPGKNVVTRNSIDSSVTLSNVKSYSELISDAEEGISEAQSYCSCGLPDYLLLPRGKPEGMSFQLFVMVTNSLEDRVAGASGKRCQNAASYCGILNERYPDKKPMGFPFDRRIAAPADSLTNFKTINMNFTDVSIRFLNKVVNTKDSKIS